jgi:predicted HAD superfamily Cof-like phosphohydrolase
VDFSDISQSDFEPYALSEPLFDVAQFQRANGIARPAVPAMIPRERLEQRFGYSAEENQELLDAETLWDQADAAIDKIYLGLGDLDEMGLDASPLWNIVQAANMAKLGPDGKPFPHPTIPGKVGKPPGWVKPDAWLQAEVERQIRVAEAQLSGAPIDAKDRSAISYHEALN